MNLGSSHIMGPELRQEVERQLILDGRHYGLEAHQFNFDWSESCEEGHYTEWLDGALENFSGIAIYADNEFIADGWMGFVVEETEPKKLIIYWEFLSFGNDEMKSKVGIPDHIWDQLSLETQQKLGNEARMRQIKLP